MNDGGGYEGQLEREKVKQIKNKRRGGKRGLDGGRQRERRTLSKRLRAEEKMNRELETERGIQRMNEDRERVREDALFSSISICTKLSLPPIWAGSRRLDH